MYSLRDILSGYVKKERNAEGSPCNEQSSKTLFSKETFECSMENGNPVSSRASDLELGHQTDSLPDTFECSKESGNPTPFRARDCGLDHQTGSSAQGTDTSLAGFCERQGLVRLDCKPLWWKMSPQGIGRRRKSSVRSCQYLVHTLNHTGKITTVAGNKSKFCSIM